MLRTHLTELGAPVLVDPSQGPLKIYRLRLEHPEPHWLLVGKARGPSFFSLAVNPYETEPPPRVAALLQSIAAYCERSGYALKLGDVLPGGTLEERIEEDVEWPDHPVHLSDFIVVPDPVLPSITIPSGTFEVCRLLGVTQDEVDLIESWNALSFAEEFQEGHPALVSDITRDSVLNGAFLRRCIQRAGQEGCSVGQLHFSGGWTIDDEDCLQLHIPGGDEARRILNVLRGRLPFDRPLFLVGPEGSGSVAFVPRDDFRAVLQDDDTLVFFGRMHTPEIQQILSFFQPNGPDVIARLG